MRGERSPVRRHFNMVFLRQFLVGRYGWTYSEVNSMRLHDAEVAALLGRHGRNRDRQLIKQTIAAVARRRRH